LEKKSERGEFLALYDREYMRWQVVIKKEMITLIGEIQEVGSSTRQELCGGKIYLRFEDEEE
jgi:hypothetical protein